MNSSLFQPYESNDAQIASHEQAMEHEQKAQRDREAALNDEQIAAMLQNEEEASPSRNLLVDSEVAAFEQAQENEEPSQIIQHLMENMGDEGPAAMHEFLRTQARAMRQARLRMQIQQNQRDEAAPLIDLSRTLFNYILSMNNAGSNAYQPRLIRFRFVNPGAENASEDAFWPGTAAALRDTNGAKANPNKISQADLDRNVNDLIGLELGPEGVFREDLDKLPLPRRQELIKYLIKRYQHNDDSEFKQDTKLENEIKRMDYLGIFMPLDKIIKKAADKNNARVDAATKALVRGWYLEKLSNLENELKTRDALDKLPLEKRLQVTAYLINKYDEKAHQFKQDVQLENEIKSIDSPGVFKSLDKALKQSLDEHNAPIDPVKRKAVYNWYIDALRALEKEFQELATRQAKEEKQLPKSPAPSQAASVKLPNKQEVRPQQPTPTPAPQPSAPPAELEVKVPNRPAPSRPVPVAGLRSPARLYPQLPAVFRVAPSAPAQGADIPDQIKSRIATLISILDGEIRELQQEKTEALVPWFIDHEIKTKNQKMRSLRGLNQLSLPDLQQSAVNALKDYKVTWRFFNTRTKEIGKSRVRELLKDICKLRFANENAQQSEQRMSALRG